MKNKYWWYETKWHQKTVKALQIAGMSESTQQAYVRAASLCTVAQFDLSSVAEILAHP